MPRALRPRGGKAPRSTATRHAALPRDVIDDVRRTARPAQAEGAVGRLERAVELLGRGDARAALVEARKAKDLAPRSPSVREVLGLAHYELGQWRDALREMQAYRRMTGRPDQNHIIADAYRALGSPEKAVPLAEEALRSRVPEDARAEAVIVAASALADGGRFDQALAMLRRISTRSEVVRQHDLRVWYVTGSILERVGRNEEAAREYRKVLRHDQTAFDTAERLAALGG